MTIEIRALSFHSDIAQELCAEVQEEYKKRYSSDGDATVIATDDFDPPQGAFFVAFRDDEPIGCGGWRSAGAKAEMKRVYVRDTARRQGLARLIVRQLEESATKAGKVRLVLNTGPSQPEAVALYRDMGYDPEPPFGYYAHVSEAIFMGKDLVKQSQLGSVPQ